MRKTFAIFAAAVLLSGAAQAQNHPQITNGDFETWTFDGANLPNYFNSFQTADGLFSGLAYDKNNRQVKRSTDKRPGSPGSYSCSIWSRKVSGVVAQGNLTTGRVHAAAMSATGKNNYNYSDRDGSNTNNGVNNPCAMPFTGKPDSLVVWVKFAPSGTDSSHPYAKVTATIHSDFDYIDGYAQTSDSKYVVATAINMTIAKTNGQWKRLSIPFKYTNNGAQPKYILLSAATNAYPGGGNENDYLYLDDITLVYKQSYRLDIPSQGWATLCLDFNAKAPAGAKVYTVTELVAGYPPEASFRQTPASSSVLMPPLSLSRAASWTRCPSAETSWRAGPRQAAARPDSTTCSPPPPRRTAPSSASTRGLRSPPTRPISRSGSNFFGGKLANLKK